MNHKQQRGFCSLGSGAHTLYSTMINDHRNHDQLSEWRMDYNMTI